RKWPNRATTRRRILQRRSDQHREPGTSHIPTLPFSSNSSTGWLNSLDVFRLPPELVPNSTPRTPAAIPAVV
ncbi:hypothetical protein J6590_093497, partial [Homalodisca vitripennis]